jgi:hypothetical protein
MGQLTDTELREFLIDLSQSDVSISEWEEGFLESMLDSRTNRDISEKQREVILRMVSKYDHKIK